MSIFKSPVGPRKVSPHEAVGVAMWRPFAWNWAWNTVEWTTPACQQLGVEVRIDGLIYSIQFPTENGLDKIEF